MKGKVTLWPLIAAVYLMVAGGPFGLEDTVSQSGYLGAILILMVTPLLWALPAALMVAELSSTLPEDGGMYVWAKRSMGPFWGFQEAWLSLAGSIFDMAIYPTLFVSYIGHFNPAVTANGKGLWIGVGLIAVCALSMVVIGLGLIAGDVDTGPFAFVYWALPTLVTQLPGVEIEVQNQSRRNVQALVPNTSS